MSRYWSEVVHTLTPYVPGEQPKIDGLVKLNTNECPYPPSALAVQAIADENGAALRLYPDPQAGALKAAIARHHRVTTDQVFVGNGSDEVLAHAYMALLRHDAPLLTPDISYSFYPVYARLYGVATREIPLDDGYAVRVDDYLRAGPNGGIIFPNPNAPTGVAIPLADVRRLLQGNPDSVVVIDEAYADFGGDTAVPLIDAHPQLLVVRTLSKSHALAGLRVGYALGHPDLIEALVRVKDSFNSYPLDRLAIAGGVAALDDVVWFTQTRERIVATRERMVAALQARQFEVLPSAANFVFARLADRDAAELAAALRAHRVLVRHFRQPERIAQFLRISVGTEPQIDALLAALDLVLSH